METGYKAGLTGYMSSRDANRKYKTIIFTCTKYYEEGIAYTKYYLLGNTLLAFTL